MKILIFGASGRTGMELVKQALELGHEVTAFVRDPKKILTHHQNLTIAQGDVQDFASIDRAMAGQEVVLSALGSPTLKQNTIISEGMKCIIEAMKRHGVRRLICESSLGVGDSKRLMGGSIGGVVFRTIFMGFVLKHVFADKELEEVSIRESGLEWIIVRPGGLTDAPKTGVCRTLNSDAKPPKATQISRADVADFMLKQISDDTWLHKTPGIVS